MVEKKYECEKCGKKVSMSNGDNPYCCGKRMKPIPMDVCLQPAHAEHSRPMNDEEPCDNGRAG